MSNYELLTDYIEVVKQFIGILFDGLGDYGILKLIVINQSSLLLLMLCSYFLASLLFKKQSFASMIEKLSILTTIGLGLISTLFFAVGAFGYYYPMQFILVLFGVLLANELFQYSIGRKRLVAGSIKAIKGTVKYVLFILILLMILIPILLLSLYPESTWDATMYHLVYSKTYLAEHSISPIENIRVPVFPQLVETLQGVLFSLTGDDTSTRFLNILFLILISSMLYSLGARYYSKKVGYWSAILSISVPLVIYIAGTSYIDVGLALYFTAAIYALLRWIESKEKYWTYFCAMFIGFASGVKYTGLVLAIIIFLIYVGYSLKDKGKKKDILLLPLVAFATSLPWFLYNFYYTLNPFFPFYQNIFGYRGWTSGDFENMVQSLKEDYGMGRGIKEFLMLPWNLTFHPVNFFAEARWSDFFLLGTPFVLFRTLKDKYVRILLILTVGFILFWFTEGQVYRYLMPIIPILCLATVASFDQILFKNIFRTGHNLFVIIVSLILIMPGTLYAMRNVSDKGMIPSTESDKKIYLNKFVYPYPAIELLNREKGANYRLFQIFSENMYYYTDGYMIGEWVGKERYDEITPVLNDSKKLLDVLLTKKVEYFLFTTHRVKNEINRDSFFTEHFKLVYAKPGIYLYELHKETIQQVLGEELLQNPDFEIHEEKGLKNWSEEGSPFINNEMKSYISTGKNSVMIDVKNNVYQLLTVAEESKKSGELMSDKVYRLSVQGRSFYENSNLRLQISWLDENSKFIYADIEDHLIGTQWKSYESYFTPPNTAKFGVLYFRSIDGSVFIDHASLKNISYAKGG